MMLTCVFAFGFYDFYVARIHIGNCKWLSLAASYKVKIHTGWISISAVNCNYLLGIYPAFLSQVILRKTCTCLCFANSSPSPGVTNDVDHRVGWTLLQEVCKVIQVNLLLLQ